jgi:hypothetical protein
MLLFQSPSWISKAERSKAGCDVCKTEYGEKKRDSRQGFGKKKQEQKKRENNLLVY